MSKTANLSAALSLAKGKTTEPLSSTLGPVAAPLSEAVPAQPARKYKDRPADEKPTFVSLKLDIRDALDELKFRSKRSLNDLANEAFRDLLEKYRYPIGR